jgi:hypothetical protein
MPKLTPQQTAQLTATLQDTALTGVVFTPPADGYRLSATAACTRLDTPAFNLAINWVDNGHGTQRLSESINGVTVVADDTTPQQRIALNQLQRLLTMAIKYFRDHISLAETDPANARGKARATSHVTINVPTPDEARASTIEALNETAAAATGSQTAK